MEKDIFQILEEFEVGTEEVDRELSYFRDTHGKIEDVLNGEDADLHLPEDREQLELLYRDMEEKIENKEKEKNSKILRANRLFQELSQDLRRHQREEISREQIEEKYGCSLKNCLEYVSDFPEIRDEKKRNQNRNAVEEVYEPSLETIEEAVDDYLAFKDTFQFRRDCYMEGKISESEMAETALKIGRKRKIAEEAIKMLDDIEGVDTEDFEEENYRELGKEEYHNHVRAGIIYNEFCEEQSLDFSNDYWKDQIINTFVKKGEKEPSLKFS